MSARNLAVLLRVAVLATATLSHVVSAASVETGKVNAMQSLTEADNNRTLDLRAGDTVSVNLSENATTGYRWAIDHVDSDIIAATGSEPHYPGGPPGAGGSVAFTFKATKAGSGEVALKYWRHFEGDKPDNKHFQFRVNVKP